MKYNSKTANEIFTLFKDTTLVDILEDKDGELMLVFKDKKCLRGLTISENAYTSEIREVNS